LQPGDFRGGEGTGQGAEGIGEEHGGWGKEPILPGGGGDWRSGSGWKVLSCITGWWAAGVGLIIKFLKE
jgi:hypothetical protein